MAYTIQLNTGYPVPKYATFENNLDPMPIARSREVTQARALQLGRDGFEEYLNQHSILTACRIEQGAIFDAATDIQMHDPRQSGPTPKGSPPVG